MVSILLLVLCSCAPLLPLEVVEVDEVVRVDSNLPLLDPPMGIGLEFCRLPLMRDSSSSSNGLTPVKSEVG